MLFLYLPYMIFFHLVMPQKSWFILTLDSTNGNNSLNWKYWKYVCPEGDIVLILSSAHSTDLIWFHISIISCWWIKKKKSNLFILIQFFILQFPFHLFTYLPMEGKDSKLCRNFAGSIIPLAPLKRKCIFEERNSIVILKYSGTWELALTDAGNSVLILIICRQVKAVNCLSVKSMIYWK